MTSNSRMMFSFARDGALPHFFYKVDKRLQSPIRAVWLAAFLSLLLGIPSVGSIVAFAAITSIATTGLYISYGLPIMIGLLNPSGCIHGPFNLGVASWLVKLVALGWIMFITIILCLPEIDPVNSQTLNYAPVCVGIVLFCCIASWFLWARKWFVGPIRQIEEEMAGMDSVAEEEESDGTEKAAPQLEFNDGDKH
jgi:amino acid transporter